MDLINKFFEGKAVYLAAFDFDNNIISFKICKAEPYEEAGELIFSGIDEFNNMEEKEGNNESGDFEGIIDIIDEGKRILFVADNREITFRYQVFEFRRPARFN